MVLKEGFVGKYIYEIINKYFHKNYRGWMKASYKIDDMTNAWFGFIWRDKNGNFAMMPKCEWTNEVYKDKFIMWTRKNIDDEIDGIKEDQNKKTLIFAKDKGNDEYYFYGVYSNIVETKEGKTIIVHTKVSDEWEY